MRERFGRRDIYLDREDVKSVRNVVRFEVKSDLEIQLFLFPPGATLITYLNNLIFFSTMFGNFGGFSKNDESDDPFKEVHNGTRNSRQVARNGGRRGEEDQLQRAGERDPFANMHKQMDRMMGGGFGGGLFGGFGGMDSLMSDMGMGAGMSSMESFSNGGGGFMQSSSTVVSSKMGPDGKMQTERYASSAVKDGRGSGAYERQQAYKNKVSI